MNPLGVKSWWDCSRKQKKINVYTKKSCTEEDNKHSLSTSFQFLAELKEQKNGQLKVYDGEPDFLSPPTHQVLGVAITN